MAGKGAKLLRHYGTKLNLPLPTGEVDFVVEFTKPTKSGEGSIFKMLNRAKKKCAFTLSEVLIVLAVLGVVAAMTIPDLIQDYREKALITALKKNYTVFSQAVDMAVADNGPLNSWNVSGSLEFYNILVPYLRIEKSCGTSSGCFFSGRYKALFGELWGYSDINRTAYFAKGMLTSGTSFFVTFNGTCENNICGTMGVDVNGKSGPNRAGVDLFTFTILSDGLLEPDGARRILGGTWGCIYNNSSSTNGNGCTWWALKHENMDYLRKAGQYTKY